MIVPLPAEQLIVSGAPDEVVVPRPPCQHVVPVAPGQGVTRRAATDPLDVGADVVALPRDAVVCDVVERDAQRLVPRIARAVDAIPTRDHVRPVRTLAGLVEAV